MLKIASLISNEGVTTQSQGDLLWQQIRTGFVNRWSAQTGQRSKGEKTRHEGKVAGMYVVELIRGLGTGVQVDVRRWLKTGNAEEGANC